MSETNNFKHLELVVRRDGKKIYPRNMMIPPPESVINNKANRRQHSQKLYTQAVGIINGWNDDNLYRNQNNLPNLSDKKPLLIKIPTESIDIDYLRSTFGFEVVCEYEEGLIIVATKPEEFQNGIRKILDFAEGISGSGNVAKLEDLVTEETNQQRLNRILSDELLSVWDEIVANPDSTIIVEMSIECQGTIIVGKKPVKEDDETEEHYNARLLRWEARKNNAYEEWDELCRIRETGLENIILHYNGEVTGIFDYIEDISVQDSFEIKAQIPYRCLADLALNYPFVFEIKQPDDIDKRIMNGVARNLSNPQFEIIPPDNDAPTVCVIDSGIQECHAYIESAVRSEMSKCFLPGSEDVSDQVSDGGHGTRVTGAVLYPNGVSEIEGQYHLPFHIANARVLDENCAMPRTILPSKLLGEIIKEYAVEKGVRIFNHSISSIYPCLTKYMSSWAANIDNAVYEKDILFVQAAGNLKNDNSNPFRLGITQHLEQGRNYPDYLLENSCRIPNPAQSMQAITVGSICECGYEDDYWYTLGETGSVSSYSCSGTGLWGAIKPEVVEYGGDIVKNKESYSYKTLENTCQELIRVSPPAYAKDDVGTSYAAPKVANIAAEIERLFPNESALLYKALIIQSAQWTVWADNLPVEKKKDVLRLIGYGLPDIERATRNNEYRITFITQGERRIEAGYIHVYRVKVPEVIRNMNNSIIIDVTLVFSSKPRRTRKGFRGYFATWVDWVSSKFNEDVEVFSNRVMNTSDEESGTDDDALDRGNGILWTIGAQNNHGIIKDISRNKSSAQKDWAIMEAYKLPEEFCIAVIGHKGWSSNGEYDAKYSLCVSFDAQNNDVELYVPFAQIEVPIEVEQEIETEIEIPLQ